MTSTIQRTTKPSDLIAGFVVDIDGEVSTMSRVVDALLDLRNASEVSDLTARVDELLASIPGITTVPNGWWRDRLAELAELAEPID